MRIVHLTTVHTYNDTRIFTRMCKSLAAAGNDVHLIVPAAQLPPEEMRGNVRMHAVPPPRNRYERMSLTCWRVLQIARSIDADLYHFHDPELIPAGLLLQLSGRKVIFDVHENVPADLATKKYIPRVLRGAASKIVARCLDFACRRFSAIVTAGDDISQSIRRTKIPVTSIHNYPDLQILDQYTATPPATQPSQIIFFGGIRSNDVALNIVKALALIPAGHNLRLTLGGTRCVQSRYQQACALPGWQRVDYVGHVNFAEMLKLAQGVLGALVLYANEPNSQHLRSNRLFESMALQLPVVTPNFPRWQAFVEKYRCGIAVDPDQPQEIADAIVYLLEHPQEAREMGRRGRAVIEESWNWAHEFPKLEGLYDKLIASDQKQAGAERPKDE